MTSQENEHTENPNELSGEQAKILLKAIEEAEKKEAAAEIRKQIEKDVA